jgi:8-hydroxy-5-deazaflavin:NADPH oxidoreductase
MRIGMVGAGRIGQALAQAARACGDEVMIANSRGPDSLHGLASTLGCLAGTTAQAAAFGDMLVLAIPFAVIGRLDPADFTGRIVLDANNYYPARDGRIAALDTYQTTTSSLVQQMLHGARVVKCFNAILHDDIVPDARPRGSPSRRALPIAADDALAKAAAGAMVDRLGYDFVDAGLLDESWRFERAMPAYCIAMDAPQLRHALAAARRGEELPHGSWRQRRLRT